MTTLSTSAMYFAGHMLALASDTKK